MRRFLFFAVVIALTSGSDVGLVTYQPAIAAAEENSQPAYCRHGGGLAAYDPLFAKIKAGVYQPAQSLFSRSGYARYREFLDQRNCPRADDLLTEKFTHAYPDDTCLLRLDRYSGTLSYTVMSNVYPELAICFRGNDAEQALDDLRTSSEPKRMPFDGIWPPYDLQFPDCPRGLTGTCHPNLGLSALSSICVEDRVVEACQRIVEIVKRYPESVTLPDEVIYGYLLLITELPDAPDIDGELAQARKKLTPERMAAAMHDIGQLIHEKSPWLRLRYDRGANVPIFYPGARQRSCRERGITDQLRCRW